MRDFYSLALRVCIKKIYIKPRKITEDLWASCALKRKKGSHQFAQIQQA